MFIKCLPLLFIIGLVDAQYPMLYRGAGTCSFPRIDNGRVRVRQRSKLVKFMCNYGFELVGNRYATCRNGQWDEPAPVCVRPGCEPVPNIKSGLQMLSHHNSWMVVFCFPGHRLVGSPVIYCNGAHWNATVPTCVDSTSKPMESCDFEKPDLCGWKQDELHDFDWIRLNKRTPSSFLFTGPSYDHTLGAEGEGFFMYIESTSRLTNETARLISPIYDASLVRNGCFQFYYHMFGKDIGGLRVYQKPENFLMTTMLNLTGTEKNNYLLFEQWGDQGNQWYSAVQDLLDFSDSFQIVIEGIRGKSFTSDIAIDDVAILHGENCTTARETANTPSRILVSETCSNRCDLTGQRGPGPLGCGCTAACVADDDCCADFIELCFFNIYSGTEDDNVSSTTMDPPQTQKLVATTESTSTTSRTVVPRTTTTTTSKTTSTTTTTSSPRTTTTSTSTSTTSTTRPTPSTTTTTTTPKPTTIRPSAPKTTTTTTTPMPTTKRATTTSTTTSTTTPKPATIRPTTPTTTPKPATTKPTTKRTTTTRSSTTLRTVKPITTPKLTTKVSTSKSTYTSTSTIAYHTKHDMIEKEDKKIEIMKIMSVKKESHSSALRTAIITVVVLACCCVIAFFAVSLRTSRGRIAIARLRGRTTRDPEVRYLSADVDDE